MVPLQFGIPGGPELLVMLLILVLFGLPLVLVLVLLSRNGGDDEDRVEELERRVEELEAELEEQGGPKVPRGERRTE